MRLMLVHTKRTPMLWFERIYGAGPFEVDRYEKHLVYLKGIPDKHNGWHREKFREF